MEIAPFDNREGFIWMNGEFIKWNDAKCHVITQGLHYASAVFEGERAYKGKIFKSEEHTKRLFRSAEIVGIKIPYSQSQINEAKDELIKKMNFEDRLINFRRLNLSDDSIKKVSHYFCFF